MSEGFWVKVSLSVQSEEAGRRRRRPLGRFVLGSITKWPKLDSNDRPPHRQRFATSPRIRHPSEGPLPSDKQAGE
jgi:hypothetical protein